MYSVAGRLRPPHGATFSVSGVPMNPETITTTDDLRADDAGTRIARMSYDSDGNPFGIAICFSADELDSLGIDPERASHVVYCITDGDIQFTPGDREVSE